MAGYVITAADINNHAGSLAAAVWDDLERVRRFKLWLDDSTHNDSFLTALGISSSDITLLRNSIADLGGSSGLWAVAHGTFTPAGASNYFFNSKNLTGITYAG